MLLSPKMEQGTNSVSGGKRLVASEEKVANRGISSFCTMVDCWTACLLLLPLQLYLIISMLNYYAGAVAYLAPVWCGMLNYYAGGVSYLAPVWCGYSMGTGSGSGAGPNTPKSRIASAPKKEPEPYSPHRAAFCGSGLALPAEVTGEEPCQTIPQLDNSFIFKQIFYLL